MRHIHATGIIVVITAAGLIVGASSAQRSSAMDSAPTIALQLSNEIMSPFCPGMTLAACPSRAAAQLRSEIADRIAAGESPSQIVERLVARFGEGIRGTPRPRGLALLLWVVPCLLGGGILWGLFRAAGGFRGGSFESAQSGGASAIDPELESRLDEELLRFG